MSIRILLEILIWNYRLSGSVNNFMYQCLSIPIGMELFLMITDNNQIVCNKNLLNLITLDVNICPGYRGVQYLKEISIHYFHRTK